MIARIKQLIHALHVYSERWWYIPLMGLLVLLSLFIPIVPSDVIVVKTFLLRPKRWLYTSLLIAFCSGIAATILAYLVSVYGEAIITSIAGDGFFQNPRWLEAKAAISKYGTPALALFAFAPLPQQAAVIAAGLAKLELIQVFFAVFLGRAVKFSLYAAFFIHAPNGVMRGREFFRSRQQSKVNPRHQS